MGTKSWIYTSPTIRQVYIGYMIFLSKPAALRAGVSPVADYCSASYLLLFSSIQGKAWVMIFSAIWNPHIFGSTRYCILTTTTLLHSKRLTQCVLSTIHPVRLEAMAKFGVFCPTVAMPLPYPFTKNNIWWFRTYLLDPKRETGIVIPVESIDQQFCWGLHRRNIIVITILYERTLWILEPPCLEGRMPRNT